MRRLAAARRSFGLSDRTLTVLNALLTFHPSDELDPTSPLVVFPSNANLAARAHGMPESTLRRHLANLVAAGLIARHDSPNGKRYARRDRAGQLVRAFGFDLGPFMRRAAEIGEAADAAAQEAEEIRLLREECGVLLRDVIAASGDAPGDLDDDLRQAGRTLRRKLSRSDLERLRADLEERQSMLVPAAARIAADDDASGSDAQIERHNQRSDQDYKDERDLTASEHQPDPLSLDAIRTACPDVEALAPGGMRSWSALIHTARLLARMLGIDERLWSAASSTMGAPGAAATVACLVQRTEQIRSPGAYLRTLTSKAGQGSYTPVPMLHALLASQGGVRS